MITDTNARIKMMSGWREGRKGGSEGGRDRREGWLARAIWLWLRLCQSRNLIKCSVCTRDAHASSDYSIKTATSSSLNEGFIKIQLRQHHSQNDNIRGSKSERE